MTASTIYPNQLLPPSQNWVDPKTGFPTPAFAMFMTSLIAVLQQALPNLTSLQNSSVFNDAQLTSIIRQNAQAGNYTTVLTDGEKHLLHTGAGAHTFTIDSNANVPYPIGTALTFVNPLGSGTLTIAINADSMEFAGTSLTGARTLAGGAIATALKIAATTWIIAGTGIT